MIWLYVPSTRNGLCLKQLTCLGRVDCVCLVTGGKALIELKWLVDVAGWKWLVLGQGRVGRCMERRVFGY